MAIMAWSEEEGWLWGKKMVLVIIDMISIFIDKIMTQKYTTMGTLSQELLYRKLAVIPGFTHNSTEYHCWIPRPGGQVLGACQKQKTRITCSSFLL